MAKTPFNLDADYGRRGRVSRASRVERQEKKDGPAMRAIRPKLFLFAVLTLTLALLHVAHVI